MDTSNLTVLGKAVQKTLKHVETFDAPAGLSLVTLTSDEVVTFCPVTSQKDLYIVSIAYVPNRRCIESKSLKLYLDHFLAEQVGIFAEELTTTICNDLFRDCEPHSIVVEVRQKSRGGIVIEAKAERHAPVVQ